MGAIILMDQNKKEHKYVGWVPCVNGHLDFGLMKVGISGGFTDSQFTDVKVVEENISASEKLDSHHRKIILQSKVDWKDTPDDDSDNGKFRLFVCAEVNNSEDMNQRFLKGNVLIYPLSAEPKSFEEKTKMEIHKISHEVNESTITESYESLRNLVISGSEVEGLNDKFFKASIEFHVETNGIIYLSIMPSSTELDDESKFLIVRQVYYYLKYCMHSHRHHINEQDSITTITKNTLGSGLRLLSQLKRELTTLSRVAKFDNSTHSTNDSVGIIAYCNSLILASKEEDLIDEPNVRIEMLRLDNVKESFGALNGNIVRSEGLLELVKSKAKIWLGFSIIFLWGVSNFLFKDSSTNKYLIEQPYFIPIFIIAIGFMVYKLFLKYYQIKHSPVQVKNLYYMKKTEILQKIGLAITAMIIILVAGYLFEIVKWPS
jgi:hypothetical protein